MPNKIHQLLVREKRRYELPTAPAQFRYWDPVTKMMVTSRTDRSRSDFFAVFFESSIIGHHPVLLQFTGFHDTKNAPVYCGDVVKFGSTVDGDYMYDGKMMIGFIEWCQDKAGFSITHKSKQTGTKISTPWCFAVGLTVLGNVFENPELLEV